MASYLSALWRSLTGSNRQHLNESDSLRALRPREGLRSPRRLPNTPTKSHLPARHQEAKDGAKKSKQCPHCRKTFYLELPAGRISKPKNPRPVKANGKGRRWVSVADVYKVEDLSPTLSRGDKGKGKQSNEGKEASVQLTEPKKAAKKATKKATKTVGRWSTGGRKPRKMNVPRG